MDTKNIIINNYARFVLDASTLLSGNVSYLGTDPATDAETIKSVNATLESLRAQITLMQRAIDEYNK